MKNTISKIGNVIQSKWCLTIIVLLLLSAKMMAQIPNSGFENWSLNSKFIESPNNWHVEKITLSINTDIVDEVSSASQTTDSYAGNYAVVLSNKLSFLFHFGTESLFGKIFTLPPDSSVQNLKPAFPVSARHTTLNGYYKFTPVNGDSCQFIVLVYKYGNIVGSGSLCKSISSSYTPFTVTINYYDSTTIPDSASIVISAYKMTSGSPLGNSVLYVDNLSFDTSATSVSKDQKDEIPGKYELSQNYPNPFNPTTTINFSVPKTSFVTMKVFDVLGKEVANIVKENKPVGNYSVEFNASKLVSGIYFYQLQAGNFTVTKKLILLK